MKLVAMVIAWDLVLASYSYCVETAISNEELRLGPSLFFLFVNPALVYSRRGARVAAPGFDGRGFLRATAGAVLLIAVRALPAHAALRSTQSFGVGSALGWVTSRVLPFFRPIWPTFRIGESADRPAAAGWVSHSGALCGGPRCPRPCRLLETMERLRGPVGTAVLVFPAGSAAGPSCPTIRTPEGSGRALRARDRGRGGNVRGRGAAPRRLPVRSSSPCRWR
jgi:hypothetical protein